MTTPQEVHNKKVAAERQAKEGMQKLVQAKDMEKRATEAEVRMKTKDARKAHEDLRKQQRDLAKLRSVTPS